MLPKYKHQVLLKLAEDIKTTIGIQKAMAAKMPKVR